MDNRFYGSRRSKIKHFNTKIENSVLVLILSGTLAICQFIPFYQYLTNALSTWLFICSVFREAAFFNKTTTSNSHQTNRHRYQLIAPLEWYSGARLIDFTMGIRYCCRRQLCWPVTGSLVGLRMDRWYIVGWRLFVYNNYCLRYNICLFGSGLFCNYWD